MLTQKYKNGFITLDAEMFPSVAQETIDREIKNFEPMKKAVEKLHEHEQKDIPKNIEFDGNKFICPNCGNVTNDIFGDKYCVECGQHLKFSLMEQGYGEYTVSTDAGLAPLVAEKAEIYEDSKEVIL